MVKRPLQDAPEIAVSDIGALYQWLSVHHGQRTGVWLVTMKKAAPAGYIPTSDIVDACLCFGWVDSLPRAKDALRTMLYISPRKPGSRWSRVNKDKVAQLTAAGQITPAGQTVIDAAKRDGSWQALDDVEKLVIPPDLLSAFDNQKGAQANWDAFPRSVKRGALEILFNAKRSETRAKMIAQIVSDSDANIRPFQWRRAKPSD